MEPNSLGVYKDCARVMAKAKITEIQELLHELDKAGMELSAFTLSLGDGLNSKEALDAAVEEVTTSCDQYSALGKLVISALAPFSGGTSSLPPIATTSSPRAEVNKFSKISSTAEPTHLPLDVAPSDFNQWMVKFETYSAASWIPGPPTSGEKLRQLKV